MEVPPASQRGSDSPDEPGARERGVFVERKGPVTIVTIDRPQARNAVDGPTAAALALAFRAFDEDAGARVGVLCGQNGHFCSGADLKAMADAARRNRLEPDGDGPMGPTRMLLSKPVIAAIEGYAVAGGLELALWCDLRVVARTAVLGVFCRRFGVPLIDGGTIRLPRLVGLSHALDLILTGRPVDSAEAWRIGLANRVVPHGEALAHAILLAEELAALPQACLRNDRRSAYEQSGLTIDDALAAEFALGMESIQASRDFAGAKAFAAGAGRHGQDLSGSRDAT